MLLYANNSLISANSWLPVSNLNTLKVDWKPMKKLYTIIMYDLDAPSASSRANSPYLHWLVTNIEGNNVGKGTMAYMPPKPGMGSGLHRYVVALYEQSGVIPKKAISVRNNFDVEGFAVSNKLKLVDHEVLVVDPDTKMFYNKGNEISFNEVHPMIVGDSNLTDEEQKFCSCIIEVAEKIPSDCIIEGLAYTYRQGSMCYSPYAVCAASTHGTNRQCPANYNFDNMSDKEIEAFANLHHVSLSYPIDRGSLFKMFHRD